MQLHIKYIPNENIEPYFKAADVVCLPYYSATQSGIVMMAYGFRKPVVVTNTGGLKELVDEHRTGIVIENNNSNIIAQAVTEILENNQGIDFSENIDDKVSSLGYKTCSVFLTQYWNNLWKEKF
ncbi:MAG: glycosyltransferase family 4 protein [Bacteroidetes bacterium]|nr:glycosyltransferase family 4 protein [Bacteroidota bacterium]